ncbi:hypothetical protein F5Y14DRAFT_449721 [Nemania sp. NC0429]|nr:hypothetical protein F5Y14DRAFT_449721 [Nemania sp. NC0429]
MEFGKAFGSLSNRMARIIGAVIASAIVLHGLYSRSMVREFLEEAFATPNPAADEMSDEVSEKDDELSEEGDDELIEEGDDSEEYDKLCDEGDELSGENDYDFVEYSNLD